MVKDWQQEKQWYSSQDLEIRKTWYGGTVAEAYNRARPKYPQELCDRVIEVARLEAGVEILELGSGPGNATIGFAKRGFSMTCIEPSREACQYLEHNLEYNFREYPHVKILNTSFEEWDLETEKFDAILAANSFHWLSPEIAYSKTAKALKQDGHLILLWNTNLEPKYEEYERLQEVYRQYAPNLSRYEGREKQQEILAGLGEEILASGKFQDLISEQIPCQAIYSVDDYLLLLYTFSPYRRIEDRDRESLFAGLREIIEKDFNGKIELNYLAAFHIAKKSQ